MQRGMRGKIGGGAKTPSTVLPIKSLSTRDSGFHRSSWTPLGLMTFKPSPRATPLALPKVDSTKPLRTSSRFASKTASSGSPSNVRPQVLPAFSGSAHRPRVLMDTKRITIDATPYLPLLA